MKRGVLPVFLLALFLSFGIVSAVDTEITVQTLPEHSVDIYILQPDEEYSLIKDFHVSSNKSGVASATFSSDVSEFEVKVLVRKGNTQIVNERFNDTFSAGESVSLELYPEWYITQKEIEAQRLTASSNSTNNSAEILADTNATKIIRRRMRQRWQIFPSQTAKHSVLGDLRFLERGDFCQRRLFIIQ